MAATTTERPGLGTFAHGVHPPEHKHFSEDLPIEVVPTPAKVQLPLLQHVGAPSVPVVKVKDALAMGDMISKGGGFVSAPLHAPIAGKVLKTAVATLPNARHVQVMPIKADGEQLEGQALFDDVLGG